MNRIKHSAWAAAGLAVFALAAIGTRIPPASAQTGARRVVFPSVGVLPLEQMARASVANAGDSPARAVILFYDAAGNVLKRSLLAVPPRGTGFVDLTREEFGSLEGRAQVRVEVFIGNPNERPGLEVVDAGTGKTTVQIGNPNE